MAQEKIDRQLEAGEFTYHLLSTAQWPSMVGWVITLSSHVLNVVALNLLNDVHDSSFSLCQWDRPPPPPLPAPTTPLPNSLPLWSLKFSVNCFRFANAFFVAETCAGLIMFVWEYLTYRNTFASVLDEFGVSSSFRASSQRRLEGPMYINPGRHFAPCPGVCPTLTEADAAPSNNPAPAQA
eukprot:gene4594-834_t